MTMPLHRFPAIETRSAKAAQADTTMFGNIESFVPQGDPERFHLKVHSIALGALRLSAVRTTGHRIRPVATDDVTLLMPWRGLLCTDDRRRATQLREGDAILLRPGVRTTTIPTRYVGVVAQVKLDLLARRAALNPEDAWHPDRDWKGHPGPAIHRYVRHLVLDLDSPDTLLTRPAAAESAAGLLADLLLASVTADGAVGRARLAQAGLRHVQRAEEAMRAQFTGPVSITALAGSLGVSTRSLQLAFRLHRRMTPRDFVAACRLEAARDRLTRAAPGSTVASVALDCGITHLGRFAAAYRQRYGEPPSATLEQARHRC